jgi:dTDP-glucose 4,6-dehydratase
MHPHDVFDTIFEGTRRVADAAAAGGATRFLLCSSGAIYGIQPPALERIGETYSGAPDIKSPHSSYGNAKRAAEWWINTLAKEGISPVSARIFAVLGPGQPLDPAFAASSFVRDLVRGNLPDVRDGRPIRSYIYSADLVVWLLTILDVGRARDAYNVGGQDMVSIARLAEMLALVAGRSNYQLDTAPTIGVPPARYVPDTSKARTELGLKDYTPLPNAISKTMVWHLEEKNP